MKIPLLLVCLSIVCFSCNDNSNEPVQDAFVDPKQDTTTRSFFPVTSYIKGEIYNLKSKAINPVKYVTINDRTDSSWLKIEELDGFVAAFLTPEIDSLSMSSLFSEKSFLDQSINAITLTYDPINTLPDTMQLRHWDVYIDPATQKIKRIYLVKEISKHKTQQLTWVNNKWCKITTIIADENGNSKIEREEKLFWDF